MIDVGDIILDPDFAQPFTILRYYGQWDTGEFVTGPPQRIQTEGTVIAANVKDIQQMPEGDRIRGMMNFYTTADVPMYVTNAATPQNVSDIIEWRGEKYRLYQTYPYVDYGYWKAIGARIAGD